MFCNIFARPGVGLDLWASPGLAKPRLVHVFFFYIWMLHGSTKVVVWAVALLSAKTKVKVAIVTREIRIFSSKATTVMTTN